MPSNSDTNLDCLFLLGSSAAKMWTVPWSLDTQMRDASWLKLMLQENIGIKSVTYYGHPDVVWSHVAQHKITDSSPIYVCSL